MTEQNEDTFGIHTSVIFTKDMGGSLTVKNLDSGSGAVFTIVLPITSFD